MAPAEDTQLRVLVVGAGITGLLLARSLKKEGISFDIFESEKLASLYRPREWSLGIHWSLPLLKNCLPQELWDRLPEAQNDPNHVASEGSKDDIFQIFNAGTCELLKTIPALGIRRFSRRKLRTLLTEGLDIHYGKTLRDLTYDNDVVTAHFADSTSATGSLVLGSDGPSSVVRSVLVGPEAGKALPLEITHSIMQVCYNDAAKAKHVRSLSPVFSFAVAPSDVCNFITIQDVSQAERPETWVFTLVVVKAGFPDASLDDAGRLRILKEQCADLAEPWRSSILWIPENIQVSQNRLGYWVPQPWDNRDGRTTLVGDAAHPMPPHRGQGLNNCIADVAKLVEGVVAAKDGGMTLKEALDHYEKEMIPRAAQEVMASKSNAMAILNFETFMNSPIMKQGLAAAKG